MLESRPDIVEAEDGSDGDADPVRKPAGVDVEAGQRAWMPAWPGVPEPAGPDDCEAEEGVPRDIHRVGAAQQVRNRQFSQPNGTNFCSFSNSPTKNNKKSLFGNLKRLAIWLY